MPDGLLLHSSFGLLLIAEQVHSHVFQLRSLVDLWFEGEPLCLFGLFLFNVLLTAFSVHFAFVQQPIFHWYAHPLRHSMCFMQLLQHLLISPLNRLFTQILAGMTHTVLLELGG